MDTGIHAHTHEHIYAQYTHACTHDAPDFQEYCLFEAKSSTFYLGMNITGLFRKRHQEECLYLRKKDISAKLGTLIPQNRLKFVQDLTESNVVVNLIDEL